MFYTTWVFQFLTLLLGNMGFILLGGRALKVLSTPKPLKHYLFKYMFCLWK